MQKLKILHVTTAFRPHAIGGAEVVVTTLARAQAVAGHRPFIAHLSPSPEPRYEEEGVGIIPLKNRNMYDIKEHAKKPAILRRINKFYTYYNPGVLREIGDLISELEPDILHTHSLVDLSTQMWRVSRHKGVPVVHTLHDYDLLCGRSSLYRNGNCQTTHRGCWVHKQIKQLPMEHVNAFASISDFVRLEHERWGCFGPDEMKRTKTIWNPLSSEVHQPVGEQQTGHPLRLGFLGRLVPDKGIGFLLDELHKLRHPKDWTLSIGGVSPDGDNWLRQKASGLPVNFKGWVDPGQFLTEIDVLIVPSLWNEPFGLTVVEGMLAGKIVLGSQMGAIPEIMVGLGRHILFDTETPGSLAETIARVLLDPEKHRPDATVLREIARRLHPAAVMKSYDELYVTALNGVS